MGAPILKAADMAQGQFHTPPGKSRTGQIIGGIVTFVVVFGLFLYGYYAGIIPRIGGATPSTATGPTTPVVPSPFQTRQGSHTVKLDADTVNAFFAPPATGDGAEQDRLTLLGQAGGLMNFLAASGTDVTASADPMVGEWDRPEFPDYLTFDGQEFYWFSDGEGTADNYLHGEYLAMPGCYVNDDYSLKLKGRSCYSIMLRYEGGIENGQQTDKVFYDYLEFGVWGYTLIGKLWGPSEDVDLLKRI